MNRITLHITAFIVLCAASSAAMDWPSPNAVMARNFGWNDRGRPVLGTVFESEGPVLAAESGEVIFSRNRNDSACRLPSPLGAWTAVDHGDGLISVYSRCEDGAARPPLRVQRQSPVAAAGASGWSVKKGFYFILYDRRERRWVNPSMIITPFQDTRPPQIISVDLRNAQGAPVSRLQARIGQGRYTISVNASDTMLGANESPLAPHRIVCSVNGTETGSLYFETISARDGSLMVYRNGLVPAKQVYAPFPGFEAGEVFLNRGQASIEVIVQDIAGNSRSAVSRILVD
jgi:hypothetical protein